MPLRFQVDHVQRMVLGVAEGVVTIDDVIEFSLEIERNNATGYPKLVDAMGGTSQLSLADFVKYRERMRSLPKERVHGPLALVAVDVHGLLARLFAEFTSTERPAKVFTSIHDARQWLRESPIVRPKNSS